MRLRWPDPPARPVLVTVALVWLAVLAGRGGFGWVAYGLGGAAIAFRIAGRFAPRLASRRAQSIPIYVTAALLAGGLSGVWSMQREQQILTAAIPEGRMSVVAVALTDSRSSRFGGIWFIARPYGLETDGRYAAWEGPPVIVTNERQATVDAGDQVALVGSMKAKPGFAGGAPYAARLAASQIKVTGDGGILMSVGNSLRRRVIDQLAGRGPNGALLSGFLVGDTAGLPVTDVDALRQAGIAHFVAVSGANVAWFLLLWWISLGPLGVGPRRRGLWGLLALAVFAVATRWEPSVVRASLMAGMVLGGRVVGIPLDSWTALGLSGTLALLVSPELAGDLGFQLSVLATAGIMVGADILPESLPGFLRRPLGATISAQIAVTPLLLVNFGAVPLASPLTNLLAAPLVAAATLLGGIGTAAGLSPLLTLALALAGTVLDLAHWASWFPQIGAVATGFLLIGAMAARSVRLRPWVAVTAALALSFSLLPEPAVARPAAVFLDVGQGDSALLLGSGGVNVLIDGGPDPVVLAGALRRYQVRHLDLVVLTHPDDDHAAGLVGLATRFGISRFWFSGPTQTGSAWETVQDEITAAGIVPEVPEVGRKEYLGDLNIEVLGPRRRYEGPNDQSVVLLVSAGGSSVFFTGDIEQAAQRDLDPIAADILKVPHHGGATSDLSWLRAVGSDLAVISVGPNDFGHPADEVVKTIEETGSTVVRTDEMGDVVIPLVGEPLSEIPAAVNGRSP